MPGMTLLVGTLGFSLYAWMCVCVYTDIYIYIHKYTCIEFRVNMCICLPWFNSLSTLNPYMVCIDLLIVQWTNIQSEFNVYIHSICLCVRFLISIEFVLVQMYIKTLKQRQDISYRIKRGLCVFLHFLLKSSTKKWIGLSCSLYRLCPLFLC